jgi:membrane-associated phospholipid phosphatase
VGAALVWCDWHWFTDVVAGWALSGLLIQLTFGINRPRGVRPGRSPGGSADRN